MSRTYRRKRGERPSTWITHECVLVDDYTYNDRRTKVPWTRGLYEDIPRSGSDLKKHLAIYHSDGYSTMNHVPAWFTNQFCNRPFRSKMKQEVKNIMKRGGDYMDYNFNPNKHNALWNWF